MTQIAGINSNLTLNKIQEQNSKSAAQTIAAKEFAQISESSIYVFLVSSLNLPEYGSGISKSDLITSLRSLIADHSEEQDNSNQIDLLTNAIADFNKLSAGNSVITVSSLNSSKGFEA